MAKLNRKRWQGNESPMSGMGAGAGASNAPAPFTKGKPNERRTNSLADDIKLCRQLIKALGPTPSPLLKDFLALVAKLTASQEAFLYRRGSLLSREVIREIASNIAKITLDEMRLAGIENRQQIRRTLLNGLEL